MTAAACQWCPMSCETQIFERAERREAIPQPPPLHRRAAEHLAMRWSVTVCDLRLLLAIVLASSGFHLILKLDRHRDEHQLD